MIDLESEVEAGEIGQGSDHQAGADQEGARQRDFGDHQGDADATPTATAGFVFAHGPDVEPLAGSDEELATEIVRAQSSRLIDELKGSIDYCAAQRDIPAIERVVLTGGASRWPGLAAATADELGIDIPTPSPLHGIGTSSGVDAEELQLAEPRLAVAVGLALGGQS